MVSLSALCAFATLMERKLVDHLILQHENHRPYKVTFRGHSRILIKGVRNTHGTGLIVGNDGNCK